jgi:hypothetical protein
VCPLEAEGAFPGAGFGVAVFDHGERELALVVVPRAKEVDGFDIRGGSKGERKLDGGARHVG